MSVSAGSVQLNCHFFCANEIEFDLDPREVHGQADLDALLSFMEMIAVATAKPVLMTPENMHDSPFIRVVSPETAEYIPSLGMFEEMAKNRT
jgi:hypothetical protein